MITNSSSFDVFLSYSRRDLERARMLFEFLGRQGWNVFMDEKMPNATRWKDYILHHLESAACTLVLWSENARHSEWVNQEASSALNRGKLVHARLDAHLPPDRFSEYQAADLSLWNGNIRDSEWLKVLAAVASNVGSKGAVGTLESAKPYELVTDNHLALTSSSWRISKPGADPRYPWQIHVMLVGEKDTLDRVDNAIYFFDPSYGQNRPEFINPVHNAYARVSDDRTCNFGVYELANGYSIVRAAVKIRDQGEIVQLSRLVDIMDNGPWLKELYLGQKRGSEPI